MRSTRSIRVGSRGSALALRQTQEVLDEVKASFPGREFAVQVIKTRGDIVKETPLVGMGRGVFVKELERALLAGEIDLAVHSLKDLPTQLPHGLTIRVVGHRQDPRDVLVDRWSCKLRDVPAGARMGTSSPRREAQLRNLRPDLKVLPIRGNVETRLKKARGSDYDGTILAAAGILRLGMEGQIAEFLSPESFVPAPGQGALAVELREDDEDLLGIVGGLVHRETSRSAMAERAFLEKMGGGCQLPVAAYARVDGELLVLTALLAAPDGSKVLRTKARGLVDNPHEVAVDAFQRLVEMGARQLMETYGSPNPQGETDLDR